MRITLDYYRILSVPLKADSQQLDRAYKDRLQQQSRREYSHDGIAAKRKLLEQAYTVLSNSETRTEYDANFFTTPVTPAPPSLQDLVTPLEDPKVLSQEPIAVTTYIEIEPELFIGALIILYELAEYEMVLQLGTDYLNEDLQDREAEPLSSASNSSTATTTLPKTAHKSDILLSLALSYLELSREQWRKKEWEKAAISGQMGLSLIKHQQRSLFPSLEAEIAAEINLLKPYRILELLAYNPHGSPLRVKGLKLLQEMLSQRQGIEGNDNDPSGLKLDQFLCFIQQIRTYLTLQEQKEVFLAESKRGSHPGSCLAAYALIAEGYVYKKPSSILQAQKIFNNLSHSQNNYWERAICALLLGQTEESQKIIQQNPDINTFELIEKRSQNSPDLLPGLCFYGEQWLQKEVLSQFQELRASKITLAQYFGDRDVQAYLETISPLTDTNQPTSTSSVVFSQKTTSPQEQTRLLQLFPWWGKKKAANKATASKVKSTTKSAKSVGVKTNNPVQPSPALSNPKNSQGIQLPVVNPSHNYPSKIATPSSPQANYQVQPLKKKVSTTKSKKVKGKKSQKAPFLKSSGRSLLLLLGLIFGLGTLGFVLTQSLLKEPKPKLVVKSVTPPPNLKPTLTPKPESSVALELSEPEIKPQLSPESSTTAVFNQESASKVIQKWLDSKAAALGKQHLTNELDSILTASLLTQWKNSSLYYKQNNIYRQFEHTLKIRSAKINPDNPDLATVEAEVKEVAQHYQGGNLNQAQSYNDNLLVRYELIRRNGSWLIQKSEVLQTL